MYSRITSGGVLGVEGLLIQVETDITDGLPMFNMVGYLSSLCQRGRRTGSYSAEKRRISCPAKKNHNQSFTGRYPERGYCL